MGARGAVPDGGPTAHHGTSDRRANCTLLGQVPINSTTLQAGSAKKASGELDELFERTQSLRWLLVDEIEAVAAVVFGILHGNLCRAMSRCAYAKRADGPPCAASAAPT